MERDLEVLAEAGSAVTGAVCRTHGWSGPTLTYGHAQRVPEELCEDAEHLQVQTVRRPTGGGWLLHLAGDLAVSLALAGPLRPGDFRSAASWLGEMIAEACRRLGAEAMVSRTEVLPPRRAEICFARTDKNEIAVDGVKIAGIALARIRGGVLAQAAIPLVRATPSVEAFEKRWDPSRSDAVRVLQGIEAANLAATLAEAMKAKSSDR